jgi:hypothetical protein
MPAYKVTPKSLVYASTMKLSPNTAASSALIQIIRWSITTSHEPMSGKVYAKRHKGHMINSSKIGRMPMQTFQR